MALLYKILPARDSASTLHGTDFCRESKYGWFCVAICSLWFFLTINPLHLLILDLGSGYYNFKRFVQVALIGIATLLVFFREYRVGVAKTLNLRGLVLPWLASCFFIFGSAVFSDNKYHSILEGLHWLMLPSVFFVGIYIAKAGLTQRLLGIYLLVHGMVVFKGLLDLGFEVFVSESLRAGMIFSSFGNIRFFNQVQVFIIPLLLIFASRTKFYSLAYLFLFANFLLAFASGARGLLLSIIVTGLLSFVFLKPWRRQILYGLIVCAFAYMAYFLILEWLGNVGHIFRTSTSGRLAIWWELLSKLSTLNIFFGNGVGAYTFRDFVYFFGHPHNSILQFLYEWGAIATLSAVAAILWVCWTSYQQLKGDDDSTKKDIQAALLYALCAASFYSLFSGVFVMPAPQVLFFLFMGLLLGGANLEGHKVLRVNQSVSVAVRFLCAICLIVFVDLAGKYLVQQAGQQEQVRGPRFWGNGAPLILSDY
ncbi:hypothetical protein Misp06_02439 [Microbulbifer sp. NBRC 101763]|uniref:O-antigen ligase family protein n=1 Tax=Microbulbifer sp. NBRC 101763 TaxID=1113820 RepID=UPI0030A4A8CA